MMIGRTWWPEPWSRRIGPGGSSPCGSGKRRWAGSGRGGSREASAALRRTKGYDLTEGSRDRLDAEPSSRTSVHRSVDQAAARALSFTEVRSLLENHDRRELPLALKPSIWTRHRQNDPRARDRDGRRGWRDAAKDSRQTQCDGRPTVRRDDDLPVKRPALVDKIDYLFVERGTRKPRATALNRGFWALGARVWDARPRDRLIRPLASTSVSPPAGRVLLLWARLLPACGGRASRRNSLRS